MHSRENQNEDATHEASTEYVAALEGLPRADYLKERETLIEGERNAAENFDKAMLALSGGVFAVSLTFIQDIVPDPVATPLLLVSWLGFALSLLATLVSFLSSQDAWRR